MVKTEKKNPCLLDVFSMPVLAYILWLAPNFHYLKNTTSRFIVIFVFTSLGASVMSFGSHI